MDLLADLLARLPVPHLRRLSAMLDLTVPATRWSVQLKTDRVLRPLAGKLHATLIAYFVFLEHGSRDEEGGGGGGGFGGLGGERKTKPSPRTPTPSMSSLNPRKDRPYESLKDYTAKQGMARQLSRVVEQFYSLYSGSLAFLAASGRFPRVHANVASMPVDVMCATLNAMPTEIYAASLMKKSATLSSKKTATITHSAYDAMQSPDAQFLAHLPLGKVTLRCSWFEIYYGTLSFAAWAALVAKAYFVGEVAPQLETFLGWLAANSMVSPTGALDVQPIYL
jgi:hypothetical protein